MKKSFLATGLGLCLFMACTDSKTGTTTTTSNVSKNSANIREVYRAVETGDVSKTDEFFAEDIVDHYAMPNEIRGRDSLKAMLADMHNHVANLKMNVITDASSENGEYHFALTRVTGTTTDDKMGRPANTVIDELSVDVVRLKDGKAVEHWGFDDPKMVMKMMSMHEGMQSMPGTNKMDENTGMGPKKDSM